MKKILAGLAAAAMAATLVGTATASAADSTTVVTNGADSGAGTLREALENGASKIRIHPSVGTISIDSPLVYSGSEDLRIAGAGTTITNNGGGFVLLSIADGADTSLRDLTFVDEGGYSLTNQGGSHGVHLLVPGDAVGTVELDLDRVTVMGVGGHGIYVDDNQSSSASVAVEAKRVLVTAAGYGAADRDGVRVDETGDGDITFQSKRGVYDANGADGVELDERDAGDVKVDSKGDQFNANGDYCADDDVNAPLDDGCIDDGELDLDDGFDIDEADAGSITGKVKRATLDGNFDEGLDFDEEGADGIDFEVSDTTATGNVDEGIKFSEEGGGDLQADLERVTVTGSSDNDGVQLEEEGDGSVEVEVSRSSFTGNHGDGLKIEEADEGDLEVEINRITSVDNGGDDLQVEQEAPGEGELEIERSTIGSTDVVGIS